MINIAFNLNAVSQLLRELLSNSSSNNDVERRTYNRRDIPRRSSGDNEKGRFTLDIRIAVYAETRKGDLETTDVRPSFFYALQKAANRPMVEWNFIDRFTGKVIPSQEVAQNVLTDLRRSYDADQRLVARVGDMVDSLVDDIWTKYVVSAHDRRADERRHAVKAVNSWSTKNYFPEPLTA